MTEAIVPAGPLADAMANQTLDTMGGMTLLQAHKAGEINLIAPVLSGKLMGSHALKIRIVSINPDPDAGEVYPLEKKGDKVVTVGLGRVAMQKLSQAAAMQELYCKRIDDGSSPHKIIYEARYAVPGPDGRLQSLPSAVREIDLSGEPGWHESQLGADAREYLRQDKKRKPREYNIPKNCSSSLCRECDQEVFWVSTPKGKKVPVDSDGLCHFDTCSERGTGGWDRIYAARASINSRACTGAQSAAIRKAGIPSNMSAEQAAKPWCVACVVFEPDMSNPAIAQTMLIHHMEALYPGSSETMTRLLPVPTRPDPTDIVQQLPEPEPGHAATPDQWLDLPLPYEAEGVDQSATEALSQLNSRAVNALDMYGDQAASAISDAVDDQDLGQLSSDQIYAIEVSLVHRLTGKWLHRDGKMRDHEEGS